MNMLQKYHSTPAISLLFVFFIFSFSLKAMESSEYYTLKNFNQLEEKNIPKHAPLIMLLDDGKENPSNPLIKALTHGLNTSIQIEFFPIIASSSLLYNLVVRKQNPRDDDHPENREVLHNRVPITQKNWHLYSSPFKDNSLILIPKKYFEFYKKNTGLRLHDLDDITHLLPEIWEIIPNYSKLIDFLKNKIEQKAEPDLIITFLNTVFEKKAWNKEEGAISSPVIWDCIFFGHGQLDGDIAGVKPKITNRLLKFFNDKVTTGTVLILSCYSGGKNKNLLQWKKSGAARLLNYILMVNSITDAPIAAYPNKLSTLFQNFFNDAALLNDRAKSLNALIKNLTTVYQQEEAFRSSLPQVWLPGGIGFQTYDLDTLVGRIGFVDEMVHEIDEKPFIIKKVLTILLYPHEIKVPVVLNPMRLKSEFNEKESVYSEWAFLSIKPTTNFMYPDFISMIPGNAIHHFSKIIVVPYKITEGGLLRALRDSFMRIESRKTEKIFLIDEFEGRNDVSQNLSKKYSEKTGTELSHPLEKKFTGITGNLKKVIIKTFGKARSGSALNFNAEVSFEYDDSAWQFKITDETVFDESMMWDFKEINSDTHTQNYNNLVNTINQEEKVPQKSLKEILQQQIEISAKEKKF